jgi:lipopolysaccharide/colanic/teichoic acid biosynthesis glycosyltransferase
MMRKRAMDLESGQASAELAVELDDAGAVIDLRQDGHAWIDIVDSVRAPGQGLLAAPLWKRAIKRAIDAVLSLILILVLAPIMLLVVLVVCLTSRGPGMLPQVRVGLRGRPFVMYKFRSMHVGAHEVRDVYAELNEAGGPAFKIRRDPRITPVGRVIRRLSLDELPQLLNVLRGEMSLVGPRPPLPEEVAEYASYQHQRLLVRPGMTCIWQVSGRSDIDFESWVEMDLQYIREWTLGLDLRLLIRTIPAVVSGHGAY